jgi:N6-adenosine-specific RNA methylase IME4
MRLAIDKIRLDGDTQPRAQIDMVVVAEYATDTINGATLPPVTVFYDGSDYWLADGFHRVEAVKSLGLSEIEADIRPGTLEDAQWYSYGVNQAHGLRRTNEDKRRAVEAALAHPKAPTLTDTEIARHVGVTSMTVGNYRKSIIKDFNDTSERTVTRNGSTYTMNTANIGTRSAPVDDPSTFWVSTGAGFRNVATGQLLNQPNPTITAPTYDADERERRRQERLAQIAEGNRPLETGGETYPVIYADPPWQYDFTLTDNRAIENHYPTMTIDEICALPVGNIAAPDCALFLWATSPKLPEAMQLIDAWGFTYKTCMVWVKDKIGMGYYARQQHELLLIATRGNIPAPAPEARPPSVIEAPRTEHSAKPTRFYEVIERMYPTLTRLEMFSRSPRTGWAAWGNQA